jgi:hypothetical protein
MVMPKREDSFGIRLLLSVALGCATFTFRGIVALIDRQERMLEGVLVLTAGLIASLIVAQMIWRLFQESKQSGQATQNDTAQSLHSSRTEE